MRQTAALWKKAPQSEKKLPFRTYEPLVLKNRIHGGGGNSLRGKHCLFEMSLLFNCIEDNNFNDSLCREQLNKFNSCVREYEVNKKLIKQSRLLEIPKPGSEQYTSAQLTYLLRKFPNV